MPPWPVDCFLCGKPQLLVIRWVSEIIRKRKTSVRIIVMVMVHPRLWAEPFIFRPTMTLLSWVFKRWSAVGRRPSQGASCSCGNLRGGTMEQALFSQSLAPHIQPENGGPHTTTITVHCYHLMKSLQWRVNK